MTEKLSDVLGGEGTNLVYISGKLDGKQIDFDGPIEWTRKFDRPAYPVVPALPQYDPSKFKNPVFDYSQGSWIEKNEDAQGKLIVKLQEELEISNKKNEDLKKENIILTNTVKEVKEGQVTTTAILGQLMPAVQILSKFASSLQKQTEAKKEGEK